MCAATIYWHKSTLEQMLVAMALTFEELYPKQTRMSAPGSLKDTDYSTKVHKSFTYQTDATRETVAIEAEYI